MNKRPIPSMSQRYTPTSDIRRDPLRSIATRPTQMPVANISTSSRFPTATQRYTPTSDIRRNGGGGIIPGLPAMLGIPPTSQGGTATTRTGVVPPSTLTSRAPGATAGVFGGESGGMGAAAPTAGAIDLGLGGIGDSISSTGKGIMDTITELIPLAIKVILVVIVFKIILWLLRGRR